MAEQDKLLRRGSSARQSSTVELDDSGNFTAAASFMMNERASSPSVTGGVGVLWVKNTIPSTIIFTDDLGTETTLSSAGSLDELLQDIADINGTSTTSDQFIVSTGIGAFTLESGTTVRGSLSLGTGDTPEFSALTLTGASAEVNLLERTSAPSGTATKGIFWVRDDVPNIPMFTDDAGNDFPLHQAFSYATSGTVLVGEVVYARTTANTVSRADRNGSSTFPPIGIVQQVSGGRAVVVHSGGVHTTTGLTSGDTHWLDSAVGATTTTRPASPARAFRVGIAISTTELLVDISDDLNSNGNLSNDNFILRNDSATGNTQIANMVIDDSGNLQISSNAEIYWTDSLGSISNCFIRGDGTADSGDLTFSSPDDFLWIEDGGGTALMELISDGELLIGTSTEDNAQRLTAEAGTAGSTGVVHFRHTGPFSGAKTILVISFSADAGIAATDDWIRFNDSGGEVGRIHSEVLYGEFTAGHEAQIAGTFTVTGDPDNRTYAEGSQDWLTGMVVCSTGVIDDPSIGSALPEIVLCTTHQDSTVMGVFVGAREVGEHNVKKLDASKPALFYNSIGEGQILVCDKRGEVDNGDLITTSTVIGYGVKQSDDTFHSYTIAKCTQTIDWSLLTADTDGWKKTLVGCTYHCG